jgi:hypothetical protein
MRATALALTLLLVGCGDNGQQQASEPQQKHIAVRSAEQDALHKLSPENLKIALRRAIYDSGKSCQSVTDAGYVQEYGNVSMWTASCKSGKSWAIFAGPDGSAQVRDCAEMEALKLPACKITQQQPSEPATPAAG